MTGKHVLETLYGAVTVLGLMAGTASAQDARAVLQAAAAAMGAASLKTIQYSGAGWIAATGQSFSMTDDWPRFEVPAYSKVIDYDARTSREEYTRRQGSYPPRGGGFTPLVGEPRTVGLLSGNFAWNLDGTSVVPQTGRYLDGIPILELRQLELALTPHGFLKAAMAANPATAVTLTLAGPPSDDLTGNGRKATIVSVILNNKYRVNGTINDQNMVELVTTWIPNPVYGDMLYEYRYTQYKDFGGVKFPALVHVHQGDPTLNPAHNWLEIRVTSVQANVAVPAMPVPDAVRTATAPPVRVDAQKLGDGIWLMAGGSHNSVAVEFSDFITVVEAPQNEERSIAVIDAIAKLVPNKPIRYVVNTHHHFDHSGGLRTFLAQGATIVTHQANGDFYRNAMFYPSPRVLQPDRLSTFAPMFTVSRRPVPMEAVNQRYVISDGVRTLDVLPATVNHATGMLLVYLPKEKMLINADLYSPAAAGAPAPAPNANMRALMQNIQRLKLDVAQHVGIHGSVGTHDAFAGIAGRTE